MIVENDQKLKRFEDTDLWKDSIKLAREVYRLSTLFPQSEQFGLTSQIKRSVTSVSANFAEGFGRFSVKDKHHFYTIAYGSLLETKNFIYLTKELGFTHAEQISPILVSIESLQKRLNALMKSIRS